MPTDTTPEEMKPPEDAPHASDGMAADRDSRLPFPPRRRRWTARLPKSVRAPLRKLDRALDRASVRLVENLSRTPQRRHRAAIGGAIALNIALVVVLAIFGRVIIFVPNKPVSSMSIVYVDLPADLPTIDLRDPEIAPEPTVEPEPIKEPEPVKEPEPKPEPKVEPEKPPEPKTEPEPAPKPEPEPEIDYLPEPAFARPTDSENMPMIPDEPAPNAQPSLDQPLAGEIPVAGEQTPAEEAPPLLTVEPEARTADAGEDEGEEDKDEDKAGAGETAADSAQDDAPAAVAATTLSSRPAENPKSGDDMFDEEPVFAGRRFGLPAVELPRGETTSAPGQSGVVAIFCPEEFTDKEKAAECAGRPEIRSGWRPGASGEDFSKAAAVLKDRAKHGDFSGDNVTFGPEIARQMEQRKRVEDLEDFRKGQDLGNTGLASDPAAGSRPNLAPDVPDPSWTRRDDPLVDKKDVEKLRRELEEAERRTAPPKDD